MVADADDSHALFLLAIEVAMHLEMTAPEELETAINYLQAHIGYWQHHGRLDEARRVYELLSRVDGIGSHAQELAEIHVSEERLHVERRLLGQDEERLFEVFLHDCKTLLYWGLPINSAPETVLRELSAAGTRYSNVVERWQQEGGTVPEPLVAENSGTWVVNGEFLMLGHALFAPPFRSDTVYEDHRVRFDETARRALQWLLATLVDLPELPRAIRAILEAQREQFHEIAVGDQ